MIECVRAALLTPAGRLLLIRRTWPGATPYWVFPGGHVEPGDPSLRAALIREVREETGAEPQITGLLHTLAEYLVGDVDTAALHVARLGRRAAIAGAGASRMVFERWVLAQDPRFELTQLGHWLDPELLDHRGAKLPVGAQRVGLAA